MPLKSKAQERFLWSQHPDIAQKFEDETPANAKLPEHVKKMANGGIVGDDDQDKKVNDYILSEFQPKPIPTLTPGSSDQTQTTGNPGKLLSNPFATDTTTTPGEDVEKAFQFNVPHGTKEEMPVDNGQSGVSEQKDTEDKVASSHPGNSPDALAEWVKGQESQVDKYGPEQEKALFENIMKEQNSLGSQMARGGAALSDALMQVGGGSGNSLKNLQDEEQRRMEMQANLEPTLQGMNEKQMAQKMQLEGMTSKSPLGQGMANAYQSVFKQLFPQMPQDQLDKLVQNPAIAEKIFPGIGAILEKQLQMEIQKEGLDINKQRLEAETANEQLQRKLEAEKTLAGMNPITRRFHPETKGLEEVANGGNSSEFDHSAIPSGTVYKAPDGTMRRKK